MSQLYSPRVTGAGQRQSPSRLVLIAWYAPFSYVLVCATTDYMAYLPPGIYDILRSLRVPVLLTSNTVSQEAESLCSSLVEAGHADLAITEDTDVLVFDSPMLRKVGPASREGEFASWKRDS